MASHEEPSRPDVCDGEDVLLCDQESQEGGGDRRTSEGLSSIHYEGRVEV